MARYKKGATARDFDLFGHQLPFFAIHPGLVKAKAVTDETLRSEYTRLRDIAQKRLKRMAGKPEAAETFAKHPGGFPKLKDLDGRAEIVSALIDVSNFVTARRGSLSGIHETNTRITKSLGQKGITVRKEDLHKFGSFMNTMKKLYNFEPGPYGSEQFAELWTRLNESGNVSQAQYEKALRETVEEYTGKQQPRLKAGSKQFVSAFFRDENLSPQTQKAAARRRRK